MGGGGCTVKVTVPLVLHIGKNESNKLNSVWSSFNECFMLLILSHSYIYEKPFFYAAVLAWALCKRDSESQ